ncbi:MAG: hypothetical protein D6B27_09365 [Gammaproteobacteria bacterium]|nr:MAG: hypothetical protein D6B27_09365 [Gammaproteobacteria bacterium]
MMLKPSKILFEKVVSLLLAGFLFACNGSNATNNEDNAREIVKQPSSQLIIRFVSEATKEQIEALVKHKGVVINKLGPKKNNTYLINIYKDEDLKSAQRWFGEKKLVKYAEPNRVRRLH